MSMFSSLRNRIFVTSALLAVLSISVAIYLVNVRVTRELEQQLQREIVATRDLVDQLRGTEAQTFTMMARLIADAPKLKAAVDTDDPPTVQETLNSYQNENSNLLLVTSNTGRVLATVGASHSIADIIATLPIVREAMQGRESFALLPQVNGLLQLVTVPIAVGLDQPDILGTLSMGFLFDAALAARLKSITGSDIAFAMDGAILATTLSNDDRRALADRLARTSGFTSDIALASGEYVALPLPLSPDREPGEQATGPVALILRSRVEQLQVLGGIRTALAMTAVVAVLLATLLSFAVARTITQPLAAITGKMREVAVTGDLTRKIVLRGSQRWDDADARLLATTFNMLTDSIARFQREMSQKERLSSLGRLSTVIAHEVRNPLMIIKGALHTLRQTELSPTGFREALADIDEEIVRLNRIVNEVLDFARPIQFELAPADLNAICRESATAASVGAGPAVSVDLDPALPNISTDAERLRLAMVNLIVNARQSFDAQLATTARGIGGTAAMMAQHQSLQASDGPRVVVSTRASSDHVTITIADNGGGIDHEDLTRVFDPYFTTKRGGTGLGLPIAKHVVEGLGGTITVSTLPGRGTEVRLDLPKDVSAGGSL